MSNELDQLRADLEAMERIAGLWVFSDEFCNEYHEQKKKIRDKIARLEAEQADPWRRHREAFEVKRSECHDGSFGKLLVDFYDHLTAENTRLTARVAELEAANELPFWPSEGEIQAIKPQDEKAIMDAAVELMNGLGVDSAKAGEDRTVIDSANCNRLIEWFGALEDTRREFLESDDYRLAKAIYDSCGRTVPGSVLKGCWLTDVHAAKVDPGDPILDPARVLATAADVYEAKGHAVSRDTCRRDSKYAKPYRLKRAENGS